MGKSECGKRNWEFRMRKREAEKLKAESSKQKRLEAIFICERWNGRAESIK